MVSGTTSVTVRFQVMVFGGFRFNVVTYTHPDHDKVIIICTPRHRICSVIFVLTYFLVLVLVAVFEIFFSFSFVLVYIIFSF